MDNGVDWVEEQIEPKNLSITERPITSYIREIEPVSSIPLINFITHPLEKTIQLILQSAYIRSPKPLSLLVIADSNNEKSFRMNKFSSYNNIHKVTFATRWGLLQDIEEKLIQNRFISHILISDLANVLSASPQLVADVRSILTDLTEDGVTSYRSFALNFKSSNYSNVLPWGTLKLGVIAGITPKSVTDNRNKFASVGFKTRFVPFNYKLSDQIQARTIEEIITDKPEIRYNDVVLTMGTDVELDLGMYQGSVLSQVKEDRWTIAMKLLLKTEAAINGRTKVNEHDFEVVEYLTHWFHYDESNLLTESDWRIQSSKLGF